MIDRMMDRRGLDNFDLRFLGLIFAILGIGGTVFVFPGHGSVCFQSIV